MKLLDAIFEGVPVCPVAPGQTNLAERKPWVRGQTSRIAFGLSLLMTLAGCGSLTSQESENDSSVPEGISGETDRAVGDEKDPQKRVEKANGSTPTNAQACSVGSDCASGFCADGVCCDSACTGTCQACTAAKKGSGVDGVCGNIPFDNDPDNECAGGSCNGQAGCALYNGYPCAGASDCLAYCVDGFCCGNACTGSCESCSAAEKGSGYDGVCGPIAAGTDPANECNPGVCSGTGACITGAATTCSVNADCGAGGFCADGVCCNEACTGTCQACTAAKKGGGIDGVCGNIAFDRDPDNECPTGSCSGAGTCQSYNGYPCAGASDCLAYCVDGFCCGNRCEGTCESCSAAEKGQGSNGVCGPIAGGCGLTTCSVNADCASGFCTDGVCCNEACTGTCQACTAAKKGSGVDGVCGTIAFDRDPDNECPTGSCSGAGTCQSYNGYACAQNAECLSTYCVDGFCCGNACTGTCESCSAAEKGGGSNGVCGPIAGGCVGKGIGATCSASAECSSGQCVDGVCCDSACTGTCQACTNAKKGGGANGVCGPIAAGTNCATGKCDGSGTCQSYNGYACAGASECLSTYCVDGFCCGNACTGTCESCSAAEKGPGTSNGVCGFIGAGLDPDNECVNGSCNGAGICTTSSGDPNGTACSSGGTCASGQCVDGVCCDNACTGTCLACTNTKKGSGANGVCGFIGTGLDPDNECANGSCNGAGICTGNPPGSGCNSGADCASGLCSNGECVPVCNGDGVCASDENSFNCPQDCSCGDGLCSGSETPQSCFVDCKYSSDVNGMCGNGHCDPWEVSGGQILCSADCIHGTPPPLTTCGDGTCSTNETSAGCPADCGNAIPNVNGQDVIRGDGICDPSERWPTSVDCPPHLPAGTFLRAVCNGYALEEFYADGVGGEELHGVTSCSESCGATPWKMLTGTGFQSGTVDGTQVLRPDCTTCTISGAPIARVVYDNLWCLWGYCTWGPGVYQQLSYDMDLDPNTCAMAIYPYNWSSPTYYSPVPLEWEKIGEKSCSPANPCTVIDCNGNDYPIEDGTVGTWKPAYGTWATLESYCQ